MRPTNKLPIKLRVLPVLGIVIMPRTKVAFRVGREMSKLAVADAISTAQQIAVFPQKDSSVKVPGPDDLHAVGTLCSIQSHEYQSDGQIKLIVVGLERIRVAQFTQISPYLEIEPETFLNTTSNEPVHVPSPLDLKKAISLLLVYKPELERYLSENIVPYNAGDAMLADFIAAPLTKSFDDALVCFLETDPRKRLKFVYELLLKAGHEAQLESEINDQVTQAIKDQHRKIYLQGQLKVVLEELGEDAEISLHNPVFKGKNFRVDQKLAFVLMPFDERFRPIFSEIIKPIAEQFGLKCVRADDLYGSKTIIEDVWKLINEAKVIIADVTGKNPNVFYEIGLAHAVGKEVIIIAQTIEDVPFDLRHLRCFVYQDSVAGFRRLEAQLQQSLSTIHGLTKDEPQG